jgi:serpin B
MLTLLTTALLATAAPDMDSASELSQDHSQFAFSLYSAINTPEDNFVFSPFSISNCLSMVYLGARGETEAQMQKALHLTIDRKNIGKATEALNLSLQPVQDGHPSYTLKTANALFVDQETFLLSEFRYPIEKQFKAYFSKLNFSDPAQALLTINQWTSEQTEGKIPKILTPNDITAATRLVLTNAIYFQGNWKTLFNPKGTQDWPFHPTPESSLNVKMMDQTASLPYYENELLQAVALPFVGKSQGGGEIALCILLPKSAENLSVVENALPEKFKAWLKFLEPQKVALKLPKFALNTRLDLKPPLQSLGMEDPFDPSANFVGIDGLRDLFLNTAIHQAFFVVDENGVTAAAATAAGMNMTSALEKTPPVSLIVDHPFVFFLVDLKSYEVLFMGKVLAP